MILEWYLMLLLSCFFSFFLAYDVYRESDQVANAHAQSLHYP